MGYLTGKMFDHTDEICIEDMPTIARASSNFGCPRNPITLIGWAQSLEKVHVQGAKKVVSDS